MKSKRIFLSLSVALIGSMMQPAFAQAPAPAAKTKDKGELALIYSGILAGNRQKLAEYSWQLRVEVAQEGELKFVDLVKARYGVDGKLQTTDINHDLKIKKRHGLIGGNAQDKNILKLKASTNNVKDWILAYIYMSRGKVVDFFDKATPVDSLRYSNAVVVQGKDVLRPGDAVNLVIDKTTGSPLQLTFTVPIGEKSKLNAQVNFRHLRSNAAFYPDQVDAGIVSDKNEENITIKVESFDFMKEL
jgi:hypothetical protein